MSGSTQPLALPRREALIGGLCLCCLPRRLRARALRHAVLHSMQGPRYRTVYEIPRRWPVLHADVVGTVRALWEEGLLERIADPRSGGAASAYRSTESGAQALELMEIGAG